MANPILAAILSLIIPGLGQVIAGSDKKGTIFFAIFIIFIIILLFMHHSIIFDIITFLFMLFAAFDAYDVAKRKF